MYDQVYSIKWTSQNFRIGMLKYQMSNSVPDNYFPNECRTCQI